jgi:hypothetical protein
MNHVNVLRSKSSTAVHEVHFGTRESIVASGTGIPRLPEPNCRTRRKSLKAGRELQSQIGVRSEASERRNYTYR